MHNNVPFEVDAPSRQLLRLLRTQPDQHAAAEGQLPESVLWRLYCELSARGEPSAGAHCMRSLTRLLQRRSLTGIDLPTEDADPREHRLTADPMLAALWQAYKRCICSARTGPAAQLLNDIEAQIAGS